MEGGREGGREEGGREDGSDFLFPLSCPPPCRNGKNFPLITRTKGRRE